jgi:beta-exotoxin I transport system permease protein
MERSWLELVSIPLRSLRRAGIGWGVALALLIGATVAFWPAFKGTSAISQAFDQMPQGLVQALGLQDFATPAGFLRGNLYELLVPLLLAGAAVAMANGQTASEEDAGRLELYLSQPVSRTASWLGRVVALAVWLAIIALIVFVAQLAFDALVDLHIATSLVVATIALCTLLALLHGCLAFALAGWLPRPALVLAIGVVVAVAGYMIAALFPLSDLLAPWRHISPWDWALGGDPLVNATAAWRYVALAVPAILLAALGLIGFRRRDIRAA